MAETKKGKVVELKKIEFNGEHKTDKFGKFQFSVTLDNGDKGIWSSKHYDGKDWAVGTEVEYTVTKWENDDKTKVVYYLKEVQQKRSFGGGGYSSKGKKEYLAECVLVASENAANVISLRSDLTGHAFKNYMQAFLAPMQAEIEKIYAQ